ncbi:YwiC-like family protein [Halalkalibacter kiskunsagensis]|uniref:YwiC-like family protein n=1 Tax=Halalkalibacter kiskunsagensis TaxID=1548599 RepID=A0ABV6KDU5_9BACI
MVIPKEHGTWLMFFLPFLLGVFLSQPNWFHIPLFVGWFFIYLASTPFLNIVRNSKLKKSMQPWLLSYSLIAVIFIVPVVWIHSSLVLLGLFLVPLLGMNIYYIKRKNERNLLNNFSGILIFSLGGVAAYIIGSDGWSNEAFLLLSWVVFYFMGSSFYVKSMIRERTNMHFKMKSHIYHGVLLFIPWLLTAPWMTLAYFPGILKDWFTSRGNPVKPIVIGMVELGNGVIFFAFSLLFLM